MQKFYKHLRTLRRLRFSKSRKIMFAIIALIICLVITILVIRKRNKEETNYQQGIEKFSEGDFNGTVESFSKTDKVENNPDALFKVAVSYYNQKNYEEAIKSYNKLIEQNPSDCLAYNGLANVYRDQGDKNKAIENYRKSIEINPSLALTYSNLAIMLMDNGEKDEARKVVADGLKNVPNSQELKNVSAFLNK